MTTVAVLGTGIMGAPMARNLAAAGFTVRAWNRTIEKAKPLADDGATVCGSPVEAADGADCVLTMLADGDAVAAVVDADGGVFARGGDAGQIWLQMSTVGIDSNEWLAAYAAERGVAFLDAPVLGTRQPAEDGALTVLASGPEELREACQPVFDAVGRQTLWLGPAGNGSRLKLVMNSWVLMLTEATAELLAFADAAGIEPRRVLDALKGGAMDSVYLQTKGAAIVEQSFAPSFKLETALKDVQLIRELAARSGVDLALIEATEQRFEQAIAAGHGEDDMSATWHASRRPPEGG
jgi:3-hydroxyisobutyrate dehydrogenase